MVMKVNHKALNIVLPLITLTGLVLFLPPFLIYKFVRFIYRSKSTENVAGKVVLITGASSGIGEQLAYEYGRKGARLALAARREDRLQAVAEKAQRLGSPDAIMILADVSKIQDCDRLVNDTFSHFGQLDHFVSNAGVTQAGLFEDCDDFSNPKSIMDINFWGSVYCTKFAIPHLRKSKGKIVVVSSSATWFSTPRLSFYNASKAAQTCFFETLRAEIGSDDVGITIVSPGAVESEMTETPQFQSQIGSDIPSQSAEVCAKAIVESACRGDMDLMEPSWIRAAFWLRVLCPQLLESIFHSHSIKRPSSTTSSSKDD